MSKKEQAEPKKIDQELPAAVIAAIAKAKAIARARPISLDTFNMVCTNMCAESFSASDSCRCLNINRDAFYALLDSNSFALGLYVNARIHRARRERETP